MLSRRSTLGLLGSAIVCGASSRASTNELAKWQRAGCAISNDQISHFVADTDLSPCEAGVRNRIVNTGNREFDYAFAQTLSILTDTFGVLPGVTFFSGRAELGAFATRARCLGRADGSIFIGRARFHRTMGLLEHPDVALTAICAHEFAHVLQFKLNLNSSLSRNQRTVKRSELHADFLAGFFAGQRKRERAAYPAAVFAALAESIGDYEVDSPQHHGLPAERSEAIVRGFETSYNERKSISEAIEVGIKYVLAL
jgi:hypothetical protein